MSQCTCATDPQITCIVHPTTKALQARIEELEKVLQELMDSTPGELAPGS